MKNGIPAKSAPTTKRRKAVKRRISGKRPSPAPVIDWNGGSPSVIDNLREVVFQTDAQGRWTFLNRAWQEITGFSVEESLGKLFLDYVHPDDRQRNLEKFQPLIERKKDYCRHEVRYLAKGGGFRWIEVHARLTLDASGAIAGTSGTLSDVTDRRNVAEELKNARERLEFVLASNPAVIFAARPSSGSAPWDYTFMSESAESVLGYPSEAFTGNPGFWLTTVHPDDRPELERHFAEFTANGHAVSHIRRRRPDGAYRWMRTDTRLIPASGEQAVQSIGCLVDETRSRELAESLRSHAAILDAVALAAQRFLASPCWHRDVEEVLRTLGIAARASRVTIFQNLPGGGAEMPSICRYEWAAEGVSSLRGSPDTSGATYRAVGLGRWAGILSRGETVHGRTSDLPAPERALLERHGVRSALVAPIFSGRQWWGHIAVDDCAAGREWTVAEIDAFQAAANILGAAIERDQTESALRYNEALLRTMTDASPLGFYVVDNRTDRILYFNDRFCEIWGIRHLAEAMRRGELANHDVAASCISAIEDAPAFAASCVPLRDSENRTVVSDQLSFRDGRAIRRYSTQIRSADDTCFGRFYLFEDVTQQKRAEIELETRVRERTAELEKLNQRLRGEIVERESAQSALAHREAHFRTLIEDSSDLILVVTAECRIEYVSPAVTRVLGYRAQELIGRSALEFIEPGDAPNAAAQFERTLGFPGTQPAIEFKARHKNGRYRLLESVANNQLVNPAVSGIVITARDITDRRNLEEQFRQAQKMEAVGRLAGGVAHDFNNLLTVICGYSELLLKRLPEDHLLRRNVAQIKRAGDRAAALVQQLLAFSRKQVVQPSTLDLNTAIAEFDGMLRRLIPENIELRIVPAERAVYVHFDRGQLDQILMNLSVNARDAMPSGGVLEIRAHSRPVCEGSCSACGGADGGFAELTVRDTGTGMTEDVKAHIFEPFFTTKEVGKGTGLGLAMVHGAVRQEGGYLCLDSAPGKGATFRICLPRVDQPAPAAEEAPIKEAAKGGETILLVEDEELVIGMLSDALKDAGYCVLQACNGERALEIVRTCPSQIHLVVTDVIMPRMNGRDLGAKLAEALPKAKIIYMSGYPREELASGSRFLGKPLTPERLVREVRAVLDE